jgi:hypothetical protein
MMAAGQREKLVSVTEKGIDYHIVLSCQMTDPQVYTISLIRGDWQAAQVDSLQDVLLDNTDGRKVTYPIAKDYVLWATNILNAKFQETIGPVSPLPTDWSGLLEYWMRKISFFRNADNTPFIAVG